MKRRSLIFLLPLMALLACNKEVGMEPARSFQDKMNLDFADEKTSPLTQEDLENFKGLDFFPIDSKYKVVAKFEKVEHGRTFTMKTTTDRLPIYKLFGIASFELKGETFSLEIYQNQDLIKDPEYEDHLFLPFTDQTNGESSYGGGRYLDLSIPDGDEIVLDFNMAYNPYCAYNADYSCPIPPRANHLDTEIRAGVRSWRDH